MIGAVDRLFLRRAVELAERGLFTVAENPRVGCIIVRDGAVIGRGWHQRTGGPHAEAAAIADAGGDVRGATVYVSLEPCCHTGRQPPCTEALIQGGVARVVTAMKDPDARVSGRGLAALRRAGIEVASAELAEAHAVNEGFAKRHTEGRPFVRLKLAASLDGRTAMASGESRWITSAEARADVQYWRARSSAIVTGIGTVRSDDPLLNVRDDRFADDAGIRQPIIAVADSSAATPPNANLFTGGGTVLIFAAEEALREHRHGLRCHPSADVVPTPGASVDLPAMLTHLAGLGCNEVLVEAGATLAGAFIRQRLWDEAIVYLAPKVLGDAARPLARLAFERLGAAPTATICDVARLGEDVRVRLRPSAA